MRLPQDERFRLSWRVLDIADQMSLRALRAGIAVSVKPDGSPVTELDTAIERLVTEAVRSQFPRDRVLGEEFGGGTGDDSRLWIVDPVDGTGNFVESLPVYAHMIAHQEAGRTVFAVVSAPALGRRWWAYRGAGAFQGHQAITVSRTTALDHAKIGYGGLRDYPGRDGDIVRLILECRRSRGFGNFLPHMLVAEGRYDLGSSGHGCSRWDVAPLELIVTEAGGTLTDLDGLPWQEPRPVLTSNGVLHRTATATLARR